MTTMFYRFDPECRGRDILMLEGKNRRDLLLYEVRKKYGLLFATILATMV